MHLPILFELDTPLTNDGSHMHIISFRDQIQDGRLAAILVVKNAGVEHVLNHFSDTHVPMLFKLSRQIRNDGLHMHVILFRDQIQDVRLVAIL